MDLSYLCAYDVDTERQPRTLKLLAITIQRDHCLYMKVTKGYINHNSTLESVCRVVLKMKRVVTCLFRRIFVPS